MRVMQAPRSGRAQPVTKRIPSLPPQEERQAGHLGLAPGAQGAEPEQQAGPLSPILSSTASAGAEPTLREKLGFVLRDRCSFGVPFPSILLPKLNCSFYQSSA